MEKGYKKHLSGRRRRQQAKKFGLVWFGFMAYQPLLVI